MDRGTESRSVKDIKKILRGYLADCALIEWLPMFLMPVPSRRAMSLESYNHKIQIRSYYDDEQQEERYHRFVIHHSGYVPPDFFYPRALRDTLNAMNTIHFLELPAEIRLMIYELALPTGLFIENRPDSNQPQMRSYGSYTDHFIQPQISPYRSDSDDLTSRQALSTSCTTPSLLRVCRQVRSEAAPIFFQSQAFVFHHRSLFSNSDLTTLLEQDLRDWLAQLNGAVKHARKFGVEVENNAAVLQIRVVNGKCSVQVRMRDGMDEGGVELAVDPRDQVNGALMWFKENLTTFGVAWAGKKASITVLTHSDRRYGLPDMQSGVMKL